LLHDTRPEEEKTLLELKVKKAPAPTALRDDAGPSDVPATPAAAGGAAAGAAVLTAVDEDDEDGEEAPVPDDFDYLSDNQGEDE
jgi:26S proteasome regulatory subunit N2